jgi:hypothetical protein
MADITIAIAAQDMASSVMQGVTKSTRVMTGAVKNMASGVVSSTKAMASGFMTLQVSLAPLLAIAFSLKAAFAVFTFGRDSVLAFVEAGSPAGKELGAVLELASQAMNKLMVAVGGLLAPFVKVVAQGLVLFATTAASVLQPAIGMVSMAFQGLQPYIDMFLKGIIAAVTGAEVGFTNMGQVVQFAFLSMKLGFASMIEETKYTFTVRLPSYIQWFGENAYNLVRDAAVGMATVLTNFGKNLGEFGAAIYMWVSGGMKGGLDGLMNQLGQTMMVGLADGFEAQTQALPEIAARKLTESEQALIMQMNTIGTNVGNEFTSTLRDRMSALRAPGLPSVEQKKEEEKQKKATEGLAKVAEAQASIAQQLTASESRLLTRGPSEGPMQSVAQASQKTAEAAEKTSQSSDRMVELLEQLLARNFIVAEAV